MKLLSGKAEHALDAKNRIRIPHQFRKAFPEGEAVYFVMYNDRCIFIMPESSLQEHISRFLSVTTSEPDKMRARLIISERISEITEDTQGRTVLNAALREKAGIRKDVVTIGVGDHLELWAKERYEEDIAKMTTEEAFLLLGF